MKLLAPLLLFPLLATNVQAGGLLPSQVDARARWIAHVDLESFHKTQLYQALLDADEEGGIQRGLNELLETEGIDLFRDVRGATLYGTGPKDEGAVALIATTASAEPALERWQKKLGAKSLDVAGHACLEWKDGDEAGYSFLRTGSTTDRLLVVSKSKEALASALDVLEDRRPSLAKQPSAELSTTLAPGSFAFLAAAGLFDQIEGLTETGPESTVARLAQGVRVELGEHDGRFFFDARLKTKRDEDAIRVQQILQGLLALVSLAGDEPEVGATITRWSKALELTRQAQTLQLHFEYDLKLFIQEARALDAIDKEKKAEKAEKAEKTEKSEKKHKGGKQ